MWTYLRHFFDLKYVFNRVAPVVVDVVTFSWLDYQPIFAKLIPCSLPEKGEAEIQPYVIFDVFLLLSLLLLFVCFFVILFRFFFSQCRKLSTNLSKEQRVPVHQSFTRKYNMHFYQLAVE